MKIKSNLEVEIKFPIKKTYYAFLKEKIKLLDGVVFMGRKYENTLNFDNPSKDMYNQDARLRVREISENKDDVNKKVEFCYKRRLKIGDFKEEEEIETDFSTDTKVFKQILNKMGYDFSDGYERYRETYGYNDLKITIDEFPFGYILEIEGEKSYIEKLCKILNLNLQDSYKLSCDDYYSELCLLNKTTPKKYISFDDIEMPKMA